MTLRFVVEDTGSGMDAATQARLFRSFEQADSSSTRRHGGTGLGLAITRKLAESMGGSVGVWSEPGRGSRFWITFPAERIDPPAVVAPISAAPARPARGPGRRVLVVEDNLDAATMLELAIAGLGHQTCRAHDGGTALTAAVQFAPDVIFLDIGLPGINGYTVARRLREMPEMAHVHIAALTGWGQDEDRRRARDAGCDHHLTKPLSPAALEDLLVTFAVPRGA